MMSDVAIMSRNCTPPCVVRVDSSESITSIHQSLVRRRLLHSLVGGSVRVLLELLVDNTSIYSRSIRHDGAAGDDVGLPLLRPPLQGPRGSRPYGKR